MKYITLSLFFSAILGFSSCSHDDSELLYKPNIKGDAFEIKVSVSSQSTFGFSLYGEKIVIDWGDSDSEEGDYFYTESNPAKAVSHTYAKSDTTYTVKISASGLKELIINNDNSTNLTVKSIVPGNSTGLYKLELIGLPITNLDLTGCTALSVLSINGCTQISDLKLLTDNIQSFDCSNTSYTLQNTVGNMAWLKILKCRNAGLSSLDLSANKNLRLLDCRDNNFSSVSFTNLFKTLPTIPTSSQSGIIYLSLNDEYDPTEADKRNWLFLIPAD